MSEPVRIIFLGGLGEIGRNCAVVEVANRLLIIDCGLMFPDIDMPGVDLVLPDFTFLRENADRVEACVLTHGHEDHVGALHFLLRDLEFPLYGSALTLGLARNRIEEAGLTKRTDFRPVDSDGQRLKIGPFDVEFIPVTHSVPHAFAVALHTPQGIILHTGDWKLDLTPVDGRTTNIARIGALSSEHGIRLMLGDSTNAESAGHTVSETVIGESLRDVFRDHTDKRVIVTCFASHIHRIQQVMDAAVVHGRTIATLGRSMGKNVALARSLGLLNVPDASVIDIDDVGDLAPEKVCVISTGSQGEPLSALALMAAGENRRIKVGEGDVVILSSHAIPGNESNVGKVIDGLHRLGCDVVHSGIAQVHVSGHAKGEELKTMLTLARPEFFIPVHGEFRHLTHHARLAKTLGMSDNHVLLCEDGDVVVLSDAGIDFGETVPAGYLYVDGIVGDVGEFVLRDRKVLADEGVVIVVVTVDSKTGDVVSGPEIITRGWVYAPEAEGLLDEARETVRAQVSKVASSDVDTLRKAARSSLGKFVSERTRRRPMIVPIVMEV
ncbi:MAG TPA: ribonuclease J [Acidimicrobiales bacterium]|nr:ribonuclease J [Acidimicrobiales bacterium]